MFRYKYLFLGKKRLCGIRYARRPVILSVHQRLILYDNTVNTVKNKQTKKTVNSFQMEGSCIINPWLKHQVSDDNSLKDGSMYFHAFNWC